MKKAFVLPVLLAAGLAAEGAQAAFVLQPTTYTTNMGGAIYFVPDRKPAQSAFPPVPALLRRGGCHSESSGETGMRRGVAMNSH